MTLRIVTALNGLSTGFRWSRSRSVRPPLISLHPDNIVRLLEPRAQFVVEIRGRPDRHEVRSPPRAVVLRPGDSRGLHPPVECEARDEMILPRREPGEAHACDTDEARLLRDDLHVTKGAKHANESLREPE